MVVISRLPAYKHMQVWLASHKVTKASHLTHLLWEQFFDPGGDHRASAKVFLKELFPSNQPQVFATWERKVRDLGILVRVGNHRYATGDLTKIIFKHAVEEYRAMYETQEMIRELREHDAVAERKQLQDYRELSKRIQDISDELSYLRDDLIKLKRDGFRSV